MPSSRARSFALLAIGAIATASSGSCDRCAGVESCSTTPRFAVEGTIVELSSGLGQPGVRVNVIRTGGPELAVDSISTTTDASGHWAVSENARSAGDVVVDINVSSPFGSYRARGIALSTTRQQGDGQVLPPWVVDPYFSSALEVHGDSAHPLLAGVPIEFRRTGGVDYTLNEGTPVYTGATDAGGRAALFDLQAHAKSLGDLVGDVIIHLPAPAPADTLHNLRISATQLLHTDLAIVVVTAEGLLRAEGEFHERRTGKSAPGVQVTFVRIAGAVATPDSFSATTDSLGHFTFPLKPLANAGVVTGELRVTPPPPGTPFTISNVKLPVYYTGTPPLVGVWNEGPYLPWFGLAKLASNGVPGVTLEFHRTAGIQVQPSDFTEVSDSSGYLPLSPQPQDTGFVDADLVIRPPAPYPVLQTSIRLHTVEDDTTGGVAAVWELDAPPASGQGTERRPPYSQRGIVHVVRPLRPKSAADILKHEIQPL